MNLGYEPTRLRGPVALMVGCGFVAWLVMTSVAVFGFYRLLQGATGPPLPVSEAPPAPRLQIDPQVDCAAYRAQEEALLGSYGWIDRTRGIARVPLDKALDMYASGTAPSAPPASRRPRGGRQPGAWERGGAPP